MAGRCTQGRNTWTSPTEGLGVTQKSLLAGVPDSNVLVPCLCPLTLQSQTLNFLTETARGTGKHIVSKEPGNILCFCKTLGCHHPGQSIPLTKSAFTLEAGFKSERSVAYSKALGQNSSGIQFPVLGSHMSLTIMFSF